MARAGKRRVAAVPATREGMLTRSSVSNETRRRSRSLRISAGDAVSAL